MPARWLQWMPLHIDKWRGSPSVRAMHPAARSGYLELILSQWQTEDCSLPGDPLDLAELSGLGDELWSLYGLRILRNFATLENGRIRNLVCFQEWEEARQIFLHTQEVRSKAGKIGNAKRWGNRKTVASATENIASATENIANIARESHVRQKTSQNIATDTDTDTDTKTLLELSLSSPAATIRPEDFANSWNQNCGKLPHVREFTDSRRKKVQARIRQGIPLERFASAVRCCVEKPFLRGENDRGWTATFDWLVDNDRNIEKAITDAYGVNASNGKQPKIQILTGPLGGRHA